MKELLDQYSARAPEIVFEWTDAETEARDGSSSTVCAAAGGGTRMRKGLDRNEVVSLAKTMEIKFTSAAPRSRARRAASISIRPTPAKRASCVGGTAVTPLLKHYYGTGGDLNVDAGLEVIPMTEACGSGIPRRASSTAISSRMRPRRCAHRPPAPRRQQSGGGCAFPPDGGGVRYRVADMITGYGVAESVRHFYDLYGGSVRGKRVLVQGWGNVGAAAALYLAQRGAVITGIIDRVGGLLRPDGLGLDEVRGSSSPRRAMPCRPPISSASRRSTAPSGMSGRTCSFRAPRPAS